MFFRFGHNQLRGLVNASVRTIPINDDTVDTAADHVCNLTVNLGGVGGTVADIHVVRLSEPQHEMSVDLSVGAGIQQRVHVDLAHITGT